MLASLFGKKVCRLGKGGGGGGEGGRGGRGGKGGVGEGGVWPPPPTK